MTGLRVRRYSDDDAEEWDRFCESAMNATFLHTRRFLSYHGDRFRDLSCIVEDERGWLGVMPAAEHTEDSKCVVSHPGITYGGLIHAGRLFGGSCIDAFVAISRFYRDSGYDRLRYKAVPHIYHTCPAQDDLYALFRLGANRYRCDLTSCIDLSSRRPTSERRQRGLRKATKGGLTIREGNNQLATFWPVLTENLARRHNVSPIHSLTEIQALADRFPDRLLLVCAYSENRVVGGVLLFLTPHVHHAQYIAASEAGNEFAALDLLFDHCITKATASVRYFDFGISSESDGQVLNSGLYQFKTEFGGGGTVAEFYELDTAADLLVQTTSGQ